MPSRSFGSNRVLFGGLAAASCESACSGSDKMKTAPAPKWGEGSESFEAGFTPDPGRRE